MQRLSASHLFRQGPLSGTLWWLSLSTIIVLGNYIAKSYPQCTRQETRVSDIMELVHPEVPLSFDSIMAFKNSLFVFKLKGIGDIVHENNQNNKSIVLKGDTHSKRLRCTLPGSMVLIDSGKYILYLCSVNVTTVRELLERNLHISDMQRHDGTRDLIMLNQSRMSQVELKFASLWCKQRCSLFQSKTRRNYKESEENGQ